MAFSGLFHGLHRSSVLAVASTAVSLAFVCTGCRTNYRPLVAPLPPQPVAPVVVELGRVSVARKKVGLFHQPTFGAGDMADLVHGALRQVPDAEFFSDQSVNAVLHSYPTARLPVWYSLGVQFSGMAARTNLNAIGNDSAPNKQSVPRSRKTSSPDLSLH